MCVFLSDLLALYRAQKLSERTVYTFTISPENISKESHSRAFLIEF